IIGRIEAAIAPDEHVPAIARVDPERVLVGVNAAAAVGAEGLAAIAGAVEGDPEHVEKLVVAGVDATLAEIEGAWIEAVDPGPGLAAIGGLVAAAVLDAHGALAVLDVLALAAQVGPVAPVRAAGLRTTAALGPGLAEGQRELDFERLAVALGL